MSVPFCVALQGEIPSGFQDRSREIGALLDMDFSPTGTPVEVARGEVLCVEKHNGLCRITWNRPVQFYRALSHLKQHGNEADFAVQESPCFETGVMLDCSRNAVIRPQAMQTMLCRMALMGMDLAMLYTEDTYEVPGYPYFGYMRGRYTRQELQALDDYAYSLGIELIPCIQTLGHLGRALHWPAMLQYADVAEVLLADDDATLQLLEAMISAASEPFRSKRIHIGMDEAHGVGLGRHLREHGYEMPYNILRRHLLRVKEITDRLGLEPLMWSDMFFRPDSPDGEYYNTEPTQAAVDSVIPGVELVYWDYSHESTADYATMLRRHKTLTRGDMQRVCFAGAIWCWCGPAPAYDKTLATAQAALTACREAGVHMALATVWGDNGTEASRVTALPGMLMYAEYAYTGRLDTEHLRARFSVCCQGSWDQFWELSRFNILPGMVSCQARPVNAAKYLLYQDPIVQLFTKDMEGYDAAAHYQELAARYQDYAQQAGMYTSLMRFYACLARLLALKCRWHQQIAPCVKAQGRQQARMLCCLLPAIAAEVEELRLLWEQIWSTDNKPFGFEILDGRMGALKARLDTAHRRVLRWCDLDPEETLPELREEVLPFGVGYLEPDRQCGIYGVGEIVSACKIDL